MKKHNLISERFGDAFSSDYYIPVPKTMARVLKKMGLTRVESDLLIALLEYSSIDPDGTRLCNPSLETLAREDAWLAACNVRRILTSLIKKVGLVVHVGKRGRGRPNIYDLSEPLRRINEARLRLFDEEPKEEKSLREMVEERLQKVPL